MAMVQKCIKTVPNSKLQKYTYSRRFCSFDHVDLKNVSERFNFDCLTSNQNPSSKGKKKKGHLRRHPKELSHLSQRGALVEVHRWCLFGLPGAERSVQLGSPKPSQNPKLLQVGKHWRLNAEKSHQWFLTQFQPPPLHFTQDLLKRNCPVFFHANAFGLGQPTKINQRRKPPKHPNISDEIKANDISPVSTGLARPRRSSTSNWLIHLDGQRRCEQEYQPTSDENIQLMSAWFIFSGSNGTFMRRLAGSCCSTSFFRRLPQLPRANQDVWLGYLNERRHQRWQGKVGNSLKFCLLLRLSWNVCFLTWLPHLIMTEPKRPYYGE